MGGNGALLQWDGFGLHDLDLVVESAIFREILKLKPFKSTSSSAPMCWKN